MGEYVITLTVTVAVCTLATMLSPDGERGLGKYIRLVASLCILCVAIAPLASFIGRLYYFDFDLSFIEERRAEDGELQDIYSNMISEVSEAKVSQKIANMLREEYGLSDENTEVIAELFKDGDVYKIKKLTVLLSGKAIFTDPQIIREYLISLFDCECEIVYG